MDNADFRDFCLMLKRALMMLLHWIEQKYP